VKILLAEDDLDLSDVTAFALRRQGFTVHLAYSGSQALESFNIERPDVVLLDICLPEPDGIDVLARIRERSETPVIMITGRSDEPAMVQAFTAGADDYMTKPFSFRELTLRLQAVTRRAGAGKTSSELQVGRLAINPDTWSTTCNGETVNLTRLEFRILYCLASHFRRVTATERLLRFVWRDDGGDGNVLKTHISHIRQKLLQAESGLAITAVPNVGYVLNETEQVTFPGALARSNAS
jgi:DNA-binding response OmpR family regulator